MLSTIKKLIPQPIKEWLRPIKNKLIDNPKKRKLFLHMQQKHKELLQQIKGKEKIKVVFLAIHKSVWKVDPVFQKMLADPFFEPMILVCPYTNYGEERMWQDMKECYEYFEQKGYPLLSAYDKEEQRWITLEEIQPDIVFFTNSHNLTRKEYYEDAYLNYLSCYVPYHHEVGSFGNNDSQHNQLFHNAVWKIFSAHEHSFLLAKSCSASKGKNIQVTGFPAMESLVEAKKNNNYLDVWKTKDGRKRIIWSPHHLINEEINQSNFLEYADFFIDLACKFKKDVVWAFKPHPILKSKLLCHPEWGVSRTEKYYSFWEKQEFTQLELGAYEDLFLSSDCMIHDCGSFLAEYLYVEKPVLYILNEKHSGQFFNSFGKKALLSCRIGYKKSDIEMFVKNIINDKPVNITDAHNGFIADDIEPYFSNKKPSDSIINFIKNNLKYDV